MPGLLERLGEQAIGAIATLVGAEVVDLLEVLAVDARERDELDDVDRARRLLLERLQLFGREDDVLVLRELVALDRFVAGHDFVVVLGADVLLLEPRAALLVQHVERHARLGLRGRVDVDGDGDEAEGDRGGADRAGWHEAGGKEGVGDPKLR